MSKNSSTQESIEEGNRRKLKEKSVLFFFFLRQNALKNYFIYYGLFPSVNITVPQFHVMNLLAPEFNLLF